MKRCIIYCRVSTEEQAKGQYSSLEAQEDICKHLIATRKGEKEEQKWTHIDTIKDPGYSGKDLDRPGIKELLSRARTNEVDIIIVYKLDRLTRSIINFYNLYEVFEKHHVSIASATEPIDSTNPTGRLVINIILSFAQHEREMIVERTVDKMKANAEKGRWNGGMIPFGYDIDHINSILIPNENEAKITKEIYEIYLKHQNLSTVCRIINNKGYRTKLRSIQDKKGEKKRYGGKRFQEDTILRILTNPVYIGDVRYKNQTFKGLHQPIITASIFKKVQEILKKRSKRREFKKDEHVHLLKGLIKCQDCGSIMSPYPSGKKDEQGRHHLYYTCTSVIKDGKESSCRVRSLPARKFENTIKEFLKLLVQDRETLVESVDVANTDANRSLKPLLKKQDELLNRRKPLTNQVNNFVKAIGESGLVSPELKEAYNRCLHEREELDREMEEVKVEIASKERTALNLNVIRENLLSMDKIVDVLPLQDQKELMQLLIKGIKVYPFDPAKERTSDTSGVFVTGLSVSKIRTKFCKVEVQIYEVPGFTMSCVNELTKFGFQEKWLPA